MSSPGGSPSQHLDVVTTPEAFQTLLFRVFTEVPFHTHDQLNHLSLVMEFIVLPGSLEIGLKVPTL